MPNIKELYKQRTILQHKFDNLTKSVEVASEKKSKVYEQLRKVNAEIDKHEERDTLVISDHALLRWMERYLELDIEQFRNNVIPENVRKHIVEHSKKADGKYPLDNDCMVVIKNGVVVTVLPKEE